MLTQLATLRFDYHAVKKEMAPVWFSGYRSKVFALYMGLTSVLLAIYLGRLDQVQRKNDPNRIENIKTVMQLEDLDFVKMVDELRLDFNEVDLRDVEKQVVSRVSKVNAGSGSSRY